MFRKGSLFPPGDGFRSSLRIQAIISQVQFWVESSEESDQLEDDIAPPRSVASIDSIAENADFVYL
jgi:hypothetical protein